MPIDKQSNAALSILTVTRSHLTMRQLTLAARWGEDTPVSGDALTRMRGAGDAR